MALLIYQIEIQRNISPIETVVVGVGNVERWSKTVSRADLMAGKVSKEASGFVAGGGGLVRNSEPGTILPRLPQPTHSSRIVLHNHNCGKVERNRMALELKRDAGCGT